MSQLHAAHCYLPTIRCSPVKIFFFNGNKRKCRQRFQILNSSLCFSCSFSGWGAWGRKAESSSTFVSDTHATIWPWTRTHPGHASAFAVGWHQPWWEQEAFYSSPSSLLPILRRSLKRFCSPVQLDFTLAPGRSSSSRGGNSKAAQVPCNNNSWQEGQLEVTIKTWHWSKRRASFSSASSMTNC